MCGLRTTSTVIDYGKTVLLVRDKEKGILVTDKLCYTIASEGKPISMWPG